MSKSLLTNFLQKAEDKLPIFESPELATSVHWTPSENLPIHRWFRYREGFSPYLLEHFNTAKRRLDPFCGCGTTLLESSLRSSHSYGIDLNPLATFITQTKTERYSKSDREHFERLSKDLLLEYQCCPAAKVPDYQLLSKLFQPNSIDVLLKMKSYINQIDNTKLKNLLFLVWLSIIEKSSNVFKEGNGLKYRNKRRKPNKYETIADDLWIPSYFGKNISQFIENLWFQKCQQVIEDLNTFKIPKGYVPEIKTGSCLEMKNLNFDTDFDLAIFSPPYANRFDYFEAFKMELWMGDFVKESADISQLRHASMRNNLSSKKVVYDSNWEELSPFIDIMDESSSSVRMGIKNTLEGYFYDTRVLLRNLKTVLATNATVAIVVGNSAYAKSIIPTDTLVAKIGIEEGYTLKSIRIARRLHVSSQQRVELNGLENFMRESLIILQHK